MEENKENVVEETTQATEQPVEETKFNSADDDSIIKVDLSKPPKTKEETNETKEEVKQDNADDSGVVRVDESTDTPQEQEKVSEETETQEEQPVLEEVTEEETVAKRLTLVCNAVSGYLASRFNNANMELLKGLDGLDENSPDWLSFQKLRLCWKWSA